MSLLHDGTDWSRRLEQTVTVLIGLFVFFTPFPHTTALKEATFYLPLAGMLLGLDAAADDLGHVGRGEQREHHDRPGRRRRSEAVGNEEPERHVGEQEQYEQRGATDELDVGGADETDERERRLGDAPEEPDGVDRLAPGGHAAVLEPREVEDAVEERQLVEGELPHLQRVGEDRGVGGRLELVAEELGVAEDAVQRGPQLVGQPDREAGPFGGELPREMAHVARPGRCGSLGTSNGGRR